MLELNGIVFYVTLAVGHNASLCNAMQCINWRINFLDWLTL